LDFPLFAAGDIAADRLRCALYRFGGDFQIGQQLHLLPSMIEGDFLAYQGLHAPHSGRRLGILNVQFHIGRKLAGVAVAAPIVGP
jgi:hypothetical protein